MKLLNNVAVMAKKVNKKAVKNLPTILTGFGLAGVLTTTISAIKATPKALERMEDKLLEDTGMALPAITSTTRTFVEKFGVWELVKITTPVYVPTIIMGISTGACIYGANHVNLKRNAALAGLYSVATSDLKKYKSKVKDVLGEKSHQKIRDRIAEDRLKENPIGPSNVYDTHFGTALFFDSYSGRYFRHNIDLVRRAEIELNKQLVSGYDLSVTLNDFYCLLNLPLSKLGDQMGWTPDDHYINLSFSSQLASNDEACTVIDFDIDPSKL